MRPSLGRQVGAAEAGGVRNQINVTPLVDVCLVLLIIFMVVTPWLRKGIDVALPETANPRSLPEVRGQLTVSIRDDGDVYVDGIWVPQERLAATLKASHDSAPARPVVVNGDRRLPYKTVVTMLKTLQSAGFERAGLASDKRKTH